MQTLFIMPAQKIRQKHGGIGGFDYYMAYADYLNRAARQPAGAHPRTCPRLWKNKL